MKRGQIETTTHLVTDALKKATDLMSIAQLVAITGRSTHQVSAALITLRNLYGAVDAVIEYGRSYWILTGEDSRTYEKHQYTEHEKPKRKRASMLKDRGGSK